MAIWLVNLQKMPKTISRFNSPSGSRKKTTYKYVYSEKHGCPRRVPNGEVDIQDMIQSYADDVDFKSIGKMLVDTRDNVVSHFSLNGEVMDITGLPRNIHEYEAMHNKMKAEYEKLPEDLKTLFGSFDSFSTSWQDGRIGSIIDTSYKSHVQSTTDTKPEGGAE